MFNKLKEMFGNKQEYEIVVSPMEGKIIPVTEVSDPTFGQEIVGKGIAIIPSRGRVVSPVNGTISMVFETKHALTIISDKGAEILIHIGLETVKLKGQYFTTYVESGQKVAVGDLLVEFDLEGIKQAGYDSVTPMVICNTDAYTEIKTTISNIEKELTEVITLIR